MSRKLPLSIPPALHALFAQLFDPDHMLGVFRRELPPMAAGTIHVMECTPRPGRSENAFKKGALQLVYRVQIAVERAAPREFVLLGIAPVDAEYVDALQETSLRLRGHPLVQPFQRFTLHVPSLKVGLFLFPLDPSLPGLAEITGSGGARVLSAFLPECRSGARIEGIESELQHYKSFNRAVLRVRARLAHPDGSTGERAVYVKVFNNDRGAVLHRELAAVWAAAQGCRYLRVPEALGYDAEHRLLVMSEAPGARHLNDWIRCLKKGEALPAGVDLARVDRCLTIAAKALGELQESGLQPGETYDFQDELTHLRRERNLLDPEACVGFPHLLDRFETLFHRLEALAPADEPLVPAHGEYRHQQLVGDEDTLTLIDWDSHCLANPALDAARMLARLRRDALDGTGDTLGLEHLAETFRREFLAPRPEVAPHLALYEGLHMTKLMIRSFGGASRSDDPTEPVRVMANAAEQLLERAETALARA